MKAAISLISLTTMLCSAECIAQHISFQSDADNRGYYDRPYLRYEAEPDFCIDWKGEALLPPVPYSQVPLQAEASRQCAITLRTDGDFIEWRNDREADGLTLRFSLPVSPDGSGQKGRLALYAGSEKLSDIDIDSYWAWQYTQIANASEKYPDNTPSDKKFARMRFDEVYLRLPRAIAQGENFRIVKEDGSGIPYTVDFIELEKIPPAVTFDDIQGDKVLFDGSTSLQSLINSSSGKTVYIPEGTYDVPRRISITTGNVRIVGAGMWYTTLYFSASSDNKRTYAQRGFESNSNGLTFQGFTINTANNRRYFENNSSFQVGKAFQGSLGSGSVIRDIRADHFECGAWIADYSGAASRNLKIEYCRFRNNYADGINLCSGTDGAVVSHCSFRNNGDDDQAVWSSNNPSANNLYEYNTAENNWRASSCAIYGGKDNKVRNVYIADALEQGLQVSGEFPGTGFDGITTIENITIERSGDRNGTVGEHGGFWGSACPVIHVRGGYHMNVKNVHFSDIDLIDSRYRAFGISSNSGKSVSDLVIRNLHVDGVADNEWALYVDPSAVGNGSYENVTTENCTQPAIGNGSSRFTLNGDGSGIGLISEESYGNIQFKVIGNRIYIIGVPLNTKINAYSVEGLSVDQYVSDGAVIIETNSPGIYFINVGGVSRKLLIKDM